MKDLSTAYVSENRISVTFNRDLTTSQNHALVKFAKAWSRKNKVEVLFDSRSIRSSCKYLGDDTRFVNGVSEILKENINITFEEDDNDVEEY